MRAFVMAVTAATVLTAGCSADNSKRYLHPKLGVVSFNHPEFQRTVEQCNAQVFGKGITIDGKTVTDRLSARVAYLRDMIVLNKNSSERRPEHMAKPAYAQRFKELEADADHCVKAAGFEKTVL